MFQDLLLDFLGFMCSLALVILIGSAALVIFMELVLPLIGLFR